MRCAWRWRGEGGGGDDDGRLVLVRVPGGGSGEGGGGGEVEVVGRVLAPAHWGGRGAGTRRRRLDNLNGGGRAARWATAIVTAAVAVAACVAAASEPQMRLPPGGVEANSTKTKNNK